VKSAARGALLAVLALLAGCETLQVAIANLPVLGAPRRADVAYAQGARGGMDFYLPSKSSRAPRVPARPLVVFWYGGAFTTGRRQDYRFAGAALAKAGYVTVLPDYRVYPAVRFPEFLDDAARAVVAARREAASLGADPSRIVLMGHSAGAYIAAMLALEPSYLRAAGGDPAWIAGFVGLSGPYDIEPNTPVLDRIFRDTGTPGEFKPLAHVSPRSPPALLLHGTEDHLVGAEQTRKLQDALRAAGVAVSVRLYAGRGHIDTVAALSLVARHRAPVLSDVVAFLQEVSVAPALYRAPGTYPAPVTSDAPPTRP
jgi:acetyl esterase/lipase